MAPLKDREGNLLLSPVTGYEIKSVGGVQIALLLDLEHPPGEPGKSGTVVQLGMSVAQASLLAQALARAAIALQTQPTPRSRH